MRIKTDRTETVEESGRAESLERTAKSDKSECMGRADNAGRAAVLEAGESENVALKNAAYEGGGRAKTGENGKKEAVRIYGLRLTSVLLVSYVGAFLGFLVENLFRFVRAGTINDRHQLLPFLGSYGFGFTLVFLAFGKPSEMRFFGKKILPEDTKRNRRLRALIYFCMSFFVILFGEMGVGLIFEKVLRIEAWNYNSIPLHITQYTSVPTTLGFSSGIFFLMEFGFTALARLFDRLPQKTAFVLALTIGIALFVDWLVMILYGSIAGKFPRYWIIKFYADRGEFYFFTKEWTVYW